MRSIYRQRVLFYVIVCVYVKGFVHVYTFLALCAIVIRFFSKLFLFSFVIPQAWCPERTLISIGRIEVSNRFRHLKRLHFEELLASEQEKKMKTVTALSAFLAAGIALASPAPAPTSALSFSTSVTYPAPTSTSTNALIDSAANPAQVSAIKALLAESPEGASHPNATVMEIVSLSLSLCSSPSLQGRSQANRFSSGYPVRDKRQQDVHSLSARASEISRFQHHRRQPGAGHGLR